MPFSVVESPQFKKIVAAINPNYQLPLRTTLSQSLLPDAATEIEKSVASLLNEATDVSITMDSWTSNSVETYEALTGICILIFSK